MTNTNLPKKIQEEVDADSNIGDRAKPDLIIAGLGGQLSRHKGRLETDEAHYMVVEGILPYHEIPKQVTDGFVAYLVQTDDPFGKKFLEALEEDPSLFAHFSSVTGLFRSVIPGFLGIEGEQTNSGVEEGKDYGVDEYIIKNERGYITEDIPPPKASSER